MSFPMQLNKLKNSFEKWIIKKHFKQVRFLNFLLIPISFVYSIILACRFYLARPKKVNAKVICIGNAVIGGSGKTPVAIAIAKQIIKRGHRVAFISRGYKGSLSCGNKAVKVIKNMTAQQVGDEPLLLSEVSPTYICKNRYLAAKAAMQDGAEYIIMDDGLQNFSVHKDLSILIHNSDNAGNNLVLPAGPLREKNSNTINRIDCILYYHEPIDEFDEAKQFQIEPHIQLKHNYEKCILLTGIASPERVVKNLKNLGIKIYHHYEFADHHVFTEVELEKIIKIANVNHLKILTTAKDFVRIKSMNNIDLNAFEIINLKMQIPNCFFDTYL